MLLSTTESLVLAHEVHVPDTVAVISGVNVVVPIRIPEPYGRTKAG